MSQHLMPAAPSLRSRSSSSTSSLSSTFSDITCSTSASSSSKTTAFFASPFSTCPPSPALLAPLPLPTKPRSLTEEFFAIPVQQPCPPAPSIKQYDVHPSRIFPSRYTSILHRSPDFGLLNFDEPPIFHAHQRTTSSGSDSSTSSFVEPRLPTPPPAVQTLLVDSPIAQSQSPTDEEATPRPADLQPNPRHFERSLLLARPPLPDPPEDDQVPRPGSIISLPDLPLSPLSLTFGDPPQHTGRRTPTPTNDSSISATENGLSSHPALSSSPQTADSTLAGAEGLSKAPKLRLLKPLGHGAFSAVWLAEDLCRVPLTLVSKKSVRDLRRRASGRDRHRQNTRSEWLDRSETNPNPDCEPATRDTPKHEREPETAASVNVNVRRPPSRLKEGLRNMLSFSRSPTVPVPAPAPTPINTDIDIGTLSSNESPSQPALSRNPSITSSRSSSLRLVGHATQTHPQDASTLSRDSSLKKFRARVKGTRPADSLGRVFLDERHGAMGEPREREGGEGEAGAEAGKAARGEDVDGVGLGASLSRQSSLGSSRTTQAGYARLVAVKMTPTKARGAHAHGRERDEEERTRVGFVREVEVLKHISHPNITPLLAHLSTPTHHILVLPYLPGGDLLGLVNNDVAWSMLGETVLQRIWNELCKAVGWMHGVGLVHRDIKLENILLTTQTFSSLTPSAPRPTLAHLPPLPAPLIKLTDFGLSRFVDIDANGDAELLATRCGSEAYAAPELVTGGGAGGRGVYDARKTDAWACGVVLYALVGRVLPFGEGGDAGEGADGQLEGARIGGERRVGAVGGRKVVLAHRHRRQWLMRIARGEWEWPGEHDEADPTVNYEPAMSTDDEDEELVGARLVKSRGARRMVGRLLVRDPRKRARIGDLWDDVWMQVPGEEELEGAGAAEGHEHGQTKQDVEEEEKEFYVLARDLLMPMRAADPGPGQHDAGGGGDRKAESQNELLRPDMDMPFHYDEDPSASAAALNPFHDEDSELLHLDAEEEEEEEEGGCLLDQEGIDSITRQEVV